MPTAMPRCGMSARRARGSSGFLLRHGRSYARKAWRRAHRRWLAKLAFDHPAQQISYHEYVEAVVAAEARRDRLMAEIEALVPDWWMAPVVAALRAMRGMALMTAGTPAAEVGGLRRFDAPPQLFSYLGLVPSEDTTGDHVRRGPVTRSVVSTRRLIRHLIRGGNATPICTPGEARDGARAA